VDLNGDGNLDFMSGGGGSISPVGYPTAGEYSGTIFMLNDGKGNFKQTSIDGMEFGSFQPLVIQGKLGFVHFVDAGYDPNLKIQRSANEATFIQTGIPWTIGDSGNDHLYGTSANDRIEGDTGSDIFHTEGRSNEFQIMKSNGLFILHDLTGLKGTDTLSNVEYLKFYDKQIAIDLDGNAGTTAKILGAVFGKESVSNKNYVGIGLNFLDTGWTYDNLAGLALDAAGAKTNDQIVSLLWTNVIGTKPTEADKASFIALLENGMSAGALAQYAADTSFNITNINLVGLAQTGIEYIPV